ncbi:MAG: hypothetical protein WCK51_05650 [Armatimonadota bacterium]
MKSFRKPLIVTGIVVCIIGAAATIYLTTTGVLPAFRSYSAQVERAHELCFPLEREEIIQKFPIIKSDGVLIAQEIASDLGRGTATVLKAPTPSAKLIPPDPQTLEIWQKISPKLKEIPRLEAAKQWSGASASHSIDADLQINVGQGALLSRLAGHLANADRIEDACQVWKLFFLLNKARGEGQWAGARLIELKSNQKALSDFLAYAPRWRASPAYQTCANQWFDTVLRKTDYRKYAWNDFSMIHTALDKFQDLGGSWNTPFGRLLKLTSMEPLRSATRAEHLRGFIEPYPLLEANPNSPAVFDDYINKVRATHATSNKFSKEFLHELGPAPGVGRMIESLERDINLLRSKL